MTSLRLLLVLPLVAGGVAGPEVRAMTRILDANTPAHQAALRFMRGVNLGNYLEYAPGNPAANQTYTVKDFALIRAEGFDHVRVPVAWHLYAGPAPAFTLSNTIFTRADFMVNTALSNRLGVLLNLHQFNDFMANPQDYRDKFYAIWRQVAAHYSNAPPTVAFELLNEPSGAATTAVMNQIYPEAIRQIRLTNPDRTLIVGPGQWNGMDELKIEPSAGLVLPDNDRNLIVAVHCYDPYYFTHQGAEWALPDTATTGVLFPGPPPTPLQPDASITHSWVLDWFRQYNTFPTASNPSGPAAFTAKILNVRKWADYWGRPVHVGEFGCYEKADAQSRVRFYAEIRKTMDELGLGWAMWDWKAGFHYIKNSQPDPPGMRDAIFPPIELWSSSSGSIQFDAAMGKTYVVEKASSLTPPLSWRALSTQTLASPHFLYQDPELATNAAAFYQVQWIK